MARSSFGKLQRARDKQAKAAAKRERRQNRGEQQTDDSASARPGPDEDVNAEELLEQVAELHAQFEARAISLEDFEERRAALMARIPVD